MNILEAFPNYVQLFKQLQREYDRTASWHFIRREILLYRMHKVNKAYSKWLDNELKATPTRNGDR